MKSTHYLFLRCLLAVLTLCGAAQVQAQATAPPAASVIPWDERSWEERAFKGTYEDYHSFKHKKSFFFDPYIWAYSEEFADKFRMPKEWIDPELKGAIAVAWRMTTIGQTTCGLGGRADNCWPPMTCQMDIYFDSKTPLPWRYHDVVRDNFMRGLSSMDSLPWLSRESRTLRHTDMGAKGPPMLTSNFRYQNGNKDGTHQIVYFDKEYEPQITLIGFLHACPMTKNFGFAAELNFYSEAEYQRVRGVNPAAAHIVMFSRTYMKKIIDAYIAQNKPNVDITNRLIQDFFDSRKGDPSLAPRQ
jgi:hypothetical protein